jgi:CRP-like cAMP-binding protein
VIPAGARSTERAREVIAACLACGPDIAEVVTARARLEAYPPRAALRTGHEPDERLFIVIDGHARMHAYSLDGRLVVVEDFFSGDLFGEGALTGAASSADEVSAVEQTVAGIIAAPEMVALMSQYSAVAMAMSRLLVARLASLTRRLVEGSTLSATGRIHAELLRLARAGDGTRISPAPVNAQLALRVASTRETVSRTVSALLKRGILARDGEDLLIVSPHRLEELVY